MRVRECAFGGLAEEVFLLVVPIPLCLCLALAAAAGDGDGVDVDVDFARGLRLGLALDCERCGERLGLGIAPGSAPWIAEETAHAISPPAPTISVK